jgi:transcriptional regulator with XRE-family HTH domain
MRYFQYRSLEKRLSIPKVSIRQIKAARALLEWSQEELAAASGVSIPTIKRLEAQNGDLGGREDTGARILEAIEHAGVEFTNGDQPGVQLRVGYEPRPDKPGFSPFRGENGIQGVIGQPRRTKPREEE